MDTLIRQSQEQVIATDLHFLRQLYYELPWEWRLVGIKGARGVGKTTLLLQKLKSLSPETALYINLDDLYFTTHTLRETVEQLRNRGYRYFFLDEVHKYPAWSRELKNLYDLYSDIFVVFTGSSIIELHRQDVDLSRRALLFELPGLSFREFLLLQNGISAGILDFEQVLENHIEIALDWQQSFKPLAFFSDYLQYGYYPYFLESKRVFPIRLKQVINLVLETDLTTAEGGNIQRPQKIRQLLQIVADSVPFKPNISKLAERIGIDRNTLIRYLHHLERARLLAQLFVEGKGISLLQKPEKIYLDNTNIAYALSKQQPDIGNLRETFFFNQVRQKKEVAYGKEGDFLVDGTWRFEVGGRNKKADQVKHLPDSYLAVDDISSGVGNQIPLWLFGFLY